LAGAKNQLSVGSGCARVLGRRLGTGRVCSFVHRLPPPYPLPIVNLLSLHGRRSVKQPRAAACLIAGAPVPAGGRETKRPVSPPPPTPPPVHAPLQQMLSGQPPWPDLATMHPMGAMYAIARSPDGPPLPKTASEAALDFIAACVRPKPADRRPVAELLRHPFVQQAMGQEERAALAAAGPTEPPPQPAGAGPEQGQQEGQAQQQ
jgi:hypothetical protein